MKKTFVSAIVIFLAAYACFRFFSNQDSNQFFKGDDTRIRYVGRFDRTDQHAPKSWAPGSYLSFEVFGNSAEIMLLDEHKFGKLHNYIEVVIDHHQTKRIKLTKRLNLISLFQHKLTGKHHVLICKNTESAIGYVQVLGVRCQKLLSSKKIKKPIFEFIGDSITCGNGADSSEVKFGEGAWYDYHNAYLSYGPRLARELNADWILSSVSGIGMNHSCCGIKHSLPEVYERIDFHKGHRSWNFQEQAKPQVVFITLGQNDGDKDWKGYVDSYVKFIRHLRNKYPSSWIVCCVSPMSEANFKLAIIKHIDAIVRRVQADGDKQIVSFSYKKTYNSGYDQHPTVKQHEEMMLELKGFLKDHFKKII